MSHYLYLFEMSLKDKSNIHRKQAELTIPPNKKIVIENFQRFSDQVDILGYLRTNLDKEVRESLFETIFGYNSS